jgi:lysophospholipase L1-like esterase
MISGNLEWFGRLNAHTVPVHCTFVGDSLTGTGANTNYFTYFVGALNQWMPRYGFSGWMAQAVEAGGVLANLLSNHSTTQTGSTTTVIRPGEATPGGNTGLHVGNEYLYNGLYATARADDATIRTFKLNPTPWFSANPRWFEGQEIKGRMFFLRTPTGPTNYKLQGKRNGTITETKTIDLSGAETLVAHEVSCGSGSGSAEMYFLGGGGSETDKNAVHGHALFYRPGGSGFIMDSFSKGGWGSTMWASESGGSLNEGTGAYTARITDAALANQCALHRIDGSRRVFVVMIGQNDSGLTKAQHRANLVSIVNRFRTANVEPCDFILRGVPDPGVTPTSRYDDYDANVESVSREMDSPSSRVGWVKARPMLGPSGCVQGQFGTGAIFDGTHPTIAGAVAVEREFWRVMTSTIQRTTSRRGFSFNPANPSPTL